MIDFANGARGALSLLLAGSLAAVLGGCAAPAAKQASASASAETGLMRVLSGRSAMEGKALDAKLEEASAFPLGSSQNQVRAHMPQGQRAYLARLRCSDLSRPGFARLGSAGLSPYGNIVDIYEVECDGAQPASSRIFIDMYHPGHIEREAVPGFGIVGGRVEE